MRDRTAEGMGGGVPPGLVRRAARCPGGGQQDPREWPGNASARAARRGSRLSFRRIPPKARSPGQGSGRLAVAASGFRQRLVAYSSKSMLL
ncbi:MAG: hypothetical protein LBR80_13495 [Deltaproteobacteria bacterium]|jgi:hypothetical protein|nr:hypothetical protein [Deltaproteobacteria bacterium]